MKARNIVLNQPTVYSAQEQKIIQERSESIVVSQIKGKSEKRPKEDQQAAPSTGHFERKIFFQHHQFLSVFFTKDEMAKVKVAMEA
ncbi:hypothetical protein BD408DRAFT_426683, partial [Parasitella parasitica]